MIFVTQICQLMEAHVLCTKMFNSLLLLPYLYCYYLIFSVFCCQLYYYWFPLPWLNYKMPIQLVSLPVFMSFSRFIKARMVSPHKGIGFGIWEPLSWVAALPNLGLWPGFEPMRPRTPCPTQHVWRLGWWKWLSFNEPKKLEAVISG